MSFELWQKLPKGFLKRKDRRLYQLKYDVMQLVVELAKDQKFKCALCTKDRELIIEHDHDPEEGPGNRPTIYNIRGLVCYECNKALRDYEMDERGEITNWEGGRRDLSKDKYEGYDHFYKRRVRPLNYDLQAKRIGCINYERRSRILGRFDDWRSEGGQPPLWYRRYKQQESLKIETPEDAIRVLTEFVQSVNEQFKKNPNYELPEKFIKLLCQIRLIIDDQESTPPDKASTPPVAH